MRYPGLLTATMFVAVHERSRPDSFCARLQSDDTAQTPAAAGCNPCCPVGQYPQPASRGGTTDTMNSQSGATDLLASKNRQHAGCQQCRVAAPYFTFSCPGPVCVYESAHGMRRAGSSLMHCILSNLFYSTENFLWPPRCLRSGRPLNRIWFAVTRAVVSAMDIT